MKPLSEKFQLLEKEKDCINISNLLFIFYITYAERKFELRAASKQERDKWIQMLKYLKEYIQEDDNTVLKVSFSNNDSDESSFS